MNSGSNKEALTFSGVTEDFFETGTEGTLWALSDKEKERTEGPYKGLCILEEGDEVTIRSPDGKELFSGIIDPDRETSRQKRFPGDTSGQPVALGRWIHWTQKGWEADDWAALFIKSKGEEENLIEVRRPRIAKEE